MCDSLIIAPAQLLWCVHVRAASIFEIKPILCFLRRSFARESIINRSIHYLIIQIIHPRVNIARPRLLDQACQSVIDILAHERTLLRALWSCTDVLPWQRPSCRFVHAFFWFVICLFSGHVHRIAGDSRLSADCRTRDW